MCYCHGQLPCGTKQIYTTGNGNYIDHRVCKIYHLHVPIVLKLGASTSWNPQGLSRPVMGLFYLYLLRDKVPNLTNNMMDLQEV
jgi:hypothetical protein